MWDHDWTTGGRLWCADCAEDQAELEFYANRGVLVPIGCHENATDGQLYPVYREKRSLFEAMFEFLAEQGLAVRTGKSRRGRDGRMYPLYVATEYATEEDWVANAEWLRSKAGLGD